MAADGIIKKLSPVCSIFALIFHIKFACSEQQYRLHRLLAYDPHNECRGIFSDWFRFPSCCICKCYNVPFEYRVTSRSPRSMGKNFKDDDEFLNTNDGMELDDDEDGVNSNHENENWVRKKNYLNEDGGEVFSEEYEF